MPPRILPISTTPDEATREEYFLDEAKRIDGNPLQTLWNAYRDEAGTFFAGIWQSEPGKWHIRYTEEEYCEILSGASRIDSEDGCSFTVRAGDRFVIPRGFTGTWQVIETTRKVYVIYERGS